MEGVWAPGSGIRSLQQSRDSRKFNSSANRFRWTSEQQSRDSRKFILSTVTLAASLVGSNQEIVESASISLIFSFRTSSGAAIKR